jgi:hypothetical protein
VGLAGFEVLGQFVIDFSQTLVFLPEGLDLPGGFLDLPRPHLEGVLCAFEVFAVVVVLDDFALDALLDVAVLRLVLFVEHAEFSNGFLEIHQFFLSLLDAQLNVHQSVAAFVYGGVQLVVFVFVALDLFPEDLLLKDQLPVVLLELVESADDLFVVFVQKPRLLLPLPDDLFQLGSGVVEAFSLSAQLLGIR